MQHYCVIVSMALLDAGCSSPSGRSCSLPILTIAPSQGLLRKRRCFDGYLWDSRHRSHDNRDHSWYSDKEKQPLTSKFRLFFKLIRRRASSSGAFSFIQNTISSLFLQAVSFSNAEFHAILPMALPWMVGGYWPLRIISQRCMPLEIISKEVMPMSDYEIISLVIGNVGLVVTAVIAGFTIAKNNRH